MAEGELTKLLITSHSEKKRKPENKISEFSVMFNPATLNRKYEIEYHKNKEASAGPRGSVFGRVKPQEYDFEFTIDGTGASGSVAPFAEKNGAVPRTKTTDVEKTISNFLTVCGQLDGDLHRPPYLQISWGKFVFDVVLKLADITYTLFTKNGVPLRAKITATFDENNDDEIQEAKEAKNSPDLSHVRTVLEGDNISLMTRRIYGESEALYLEIAKFNKLNNFRKIKAGSQLVFPPVDKSTV